MLRNKIRVFLWPWEQESHCLAPCELVSECLWKPLISVAIQRWEGGDTDFPTLSQSLRGAFQRETGQLQQEILLCLPIRMSELWLDS